MNVYGTVVYMLLGTVRVCVCVCIVVDACFSYRKKEEEEEVRISRNVNYKDSFKK